MHVSYYWTWLIIELFISYLYPFYILMPWSPDVHLEFLAKATTITNVDPDAMKSLNLKVSIEQTEEGLIDFNQTFSSLEKLVSKCWNFQCIIYKLLIFATHVYNTTYYSNNLILGMEFYRPKSRPKLIQRKHTNRY